LIGIVKPLFYSDANGTTAIAKPFNLNEVVKKIFCL